MKNFSKSYAKKNLKKVLTSAPVKMFVSTVITALAYQTAKKITSKL